MSIVPSNQSSVIRSSQARQHSIKAVLNTIGRFLVMLLTKQPELQVRLWRDPSGHFWWTTYQPSTGETRRFRSQTEMLASIRDRRSL